jgi:hypothetical protein
MRRATSDVSIVGGCLRSGSWASGTVSAAAPSFGIHWCAPAGLALSSHSFSNSVSKKLLSHCTGVAVQVPSRPLVIASVPLPLPKPCFQPKPCSAIVAPSGSGPT